VYEPFLCQVLTLSFGREYSFPLLFAANACDEVKCVTDPGVNLTNLS